MTATEAIAEALEAQQSGPVVTVRHLAPVAVAALREAIRRDPQVLEELGLIEVGALSVHDLIQRDFPVFAVAERPPHGKNEG